MHRSSAFSSSVEVDSLRLPSRDSLLRDAVDLYVQASNHDRGEIRAFGDLVEGLIADAGIADRRHVAVTLARRSDVPPDLARRLVLDVYEVAGPMIASSPVLDAETLRSCLRCGEAHVRAVAKRLTPKISDFAPPSPAKLEPTRPTAAPASPSDDAATSRIGTPPAASARPLPLDPLDTPLARSLAEVAAALREMLPKDAFERPNSPKPGLAAAPSVGASATRAVSPSPTAPPVGATTSKTDTARKDLDAATQKPQAMPYFSVPVRPEPPRASAVASTTSPRSAPPRSLTEVQSAVPTGIEMQSTGAPASLPVPPAATQPSAPAVSHADADARSAEAGRSFFELDTGGRWRSIQRASLAAANAPLTRRRAGFDPVRMGERLYAAAVARDYPVLNLLLGDALDLDVPTAGRILGDTSFEPLAVGLAAIGLEDRQAVSILLHLAGSTVDHERMRDIAAMAVKIGQRTAEHIVAEWRQEARLRHADPLRQTDAAERREPPMARREAPRSAAPARPADLRTSDRQDAPRSVERADAPKARAIDGSDRVSSDPLRDVLDRLAKQVGSIR